MISILRSILSHEVKTYYYFPDCRANVRKILTDILRAQQFSALSRNLFRRRRRRRPHLTFKASN